MTYIDVRIIKTKFLDTCIYFQKIKEIFKIINQFCSCDKANSKEDILAKLTMDEDNKHLEVSSVGVLPFYVVLQLWKV